MTARAAGDPGSVRGIAAGVEAVPVVAEAGAGDAVVAGAAVGRDDAAGLDQLLDRRQQAVAAGVVGSARSGRGPCRGRASRPRSAPASSSPRRGRVCRRRRRRRSFRRPRPRPRAGRDQAAPSRGAACAAAPTQSRSCRARARVAATARSRRASCRSRTRQPRTRSKAAGACRRRSSPPSPTRPPGRRRSADAGPCSSASSGARRTPGRRSRHTTQPHKVSHAGRLIDEPSVELAQPPRVTTTGDRCIHRIEHRSRA